mgnify:FL=1
MYAVSLDKKSGEAFVLSTGVSDFQSAIFTPPFGAHTWQLRMRSNNDADMSISIETVDEDSHAIHVDGSPFTNVGLGGHADSDFNTGGVLEVTIDSTNPSIKVTCAGSGAHLTELKVKAYRTLEDVSTGAYVASADTTTVVIS